MTNKELEQKIKKAYEAATPDVLNAVLIDCAGKKKEPVVTYNVVSNWGMKLAITSAVAILVILLAVGWNSWINPVGPDIPTVPHLTNPPTGVQDCPHAQIRREGKKTPTCGADGYSGDEYCVDCGMKLRTGDVIPATGQHSLTPWIIAPGGVIQSRWCHNCSYQETLVTEPTEPAPTEPAPTEPTVPVDPDGFPADLNTDADVLKKFQKLFDNESWYTQTLISEFDDPRSIGLNDFLFCSMKPWPCKSLTAEEREEVWKQLGITEEWWVDGFSMEATVVEDVLQTVFGLSLADFSDSAKAAIRYLESTDCYYYGRTDASFVWDVSVVGIRQLDNGNIEVYYSCDWVYPDDGYVTLKPVGDSYHVLSNKGI